MPRPGYFDFERIEDYFGNHVREQFSLTFEEMRALFGLTPCYVSRRHLGDNYDYQFQQHLRNVGWRVVSVDYERQIITFAPIVP